MHRLLNIHANNRVMMHSSSIKVPIRAQLRHPRDKVTATLIITSLLILIAGLVYVSGGAKHPVTQLMYLPILVAALAFRLWGALGVALGAGLLLGPLMPLDVGAGTLQDPAAWLYRSGFYLVFAVIINHIACFARDHPAEGALDAEMPKDLAKNDCDRLSGECGERVAQGASAMRALRPVHAGMRGAWLFPRNAGSRFDPALVFERLWHQVSCFLSYVRA